MAVTKPGYMLEHPSIRRYSLMENPLVVKIRPVRKISRKLHMQDPQRLHARHH
jgi:hypothetical protein